MNNEPERLAFGKAFMNPSKGSSSLALAIIMQYNITIIPKETFIAMLLHLENNPIFFFLCVYR